MRLKRSRNKGARSLVVYMMGIAIVKNRMTEDATVIPLDDRTRSRISLSTEDLVTFCQENNISSMALFGSVLRDVCAMISDLTAISTFW